MWYLFHLSYIGADPPSSRRLFPEVPLFFDWYCCSVDIQSYYCCSSIQNYCYCNVGTYFVVMGYWTVGVIEWVDCSSVEVVVVVRIPTEAAIPKVFVGLVQ